MKWGIALAALVAAALTAFGLARASGPEQATASSHREAPVIADDPAADNTDLYAFRSPDRPDTVTLVANYIPLEEPAGGPNFAKFDDSVLYAIKVDSDGDAEEDLSYEFRFDTTVAEREHVPLQHRPVTSLDDPDLNVRQTYTVTRVTGKASGGRVELGSGIPTPPVNIGPRSTPGYDALAASAVSDLPGGIKVFAGQRDDPFFVDLGSVFDLAGLRPFNPFHLIPLGAAAGVDGVARLQHALDRDPGADRATGQDPEHDDRRLRERRAAADPDPRPDGTSDSQGPWVQVSRLANPLINEVVIPLGKKDLWNRSDPAEDAQFASSYTSPEVPALVNLLYPALPDIATTGRNDLVAVLLTGVPGLNFTGDTKADLLRLNTSIAPSGPVGTGNRLGVLAGEFAGFPNGRRLEDDVTDIELRALACGYGDILQQALGLCNLSPNNVLGDGVDANEKPFLQSFPYLADAPPGLRPRPPRVVERDAATADPGSGDGGGHGRRRRPARRRARRGPLDRAGHGERSAGLGGSGALGLRDRGHGGDDRPPPGGRARAAPRRSLTRAPRPRVPAAGARDRRRVLLRPRRRRARRPRAVSSRVTQTTLSGLASLAASRHDFRSFAPATRDRQSPLAPDTARGYGLVGDALLELGRYEQAFSAFERLVALKPSLAGYARIAYARELLGRPRQAIEAMALALDAAGGLPEPTAWTLVELGKLHFALGETTEARRAFRAALVAFPGYAAALDGLARVEAARGRLAQAVRLQRRAVEAVPLPHLVAQLGDLLQARRPRARGPRAVRARRGDRAPPGGERRQHGAGDRALPRRPRDPPGRDARAGPRRPRGAALDPRRRRARLGARPRRTLRRGARTYSQRSLRLGTKDASLFFHRGMIERCLGNAAEARRWFAPRARPEPPLLAPLE